MGWSCTRAANMTLDAIQQAIGATSSNGMPDGGFYEIGRENEDGAITGTVWRLLNANERLKYAHLPNVETRVLKRGSFRIDSNGKVRRFHGLDTKLLRAAETRGVALERVRYGGRDDWRSLRARIIAALDASISAEELWMDVQDVVGGYQRETRTMFMALPGVNADEYRSFFNGLGK